MKVHAPFFNPVLLAGVSNSILETPVIQCAQTGFGLFLTSSTANFWHSQSDLCPPPMTSTMDVKEVQKHPHLLEDGTQTVLMCSSPSAKPQHCFLSLTLLCS